MIESKKFLCLCYYDEPAFKSWTPSDHQAVVEACQPHDRALRATGKVVLSSSLAEPHQACVIRGSAAGPEMSPGPYAQTSQPVGAAFIVEAESMDEAVLVAALHPGVNVAQFRGMKGGIEVRELVHVEMSTPKPA